MARGGRLPLPSITRMVFVPIIGLIGFAATCAAQNYSISRTTIDFGTVPVGLSSGQGFRITATSSERITVESMNLTGQGFQFADGTFPSVLNHEGSHASFTFNFVPSAGQTYAATAAFFINGQEVDITLTGVGVQSAAVATPNVRVLSFSQTLGMESPIQTVSITNTGTDTVTILSASTEQPFIAQSIGKIVLPPGASTKIGLKLVATEVGSITGNLLITYDVLPPTGISLEGRTTSSSGFVITSFPNLPLGTIGAPYFAQLTETKGAGVISWSLADNSSLPSGLTFTQDGIISGTISPFNPKATYSLSVSAVDSRYHNASEVLSLNVLPTSGAACDYISWDVAGTNNPMIPITDLGIGSYFGTEGGLYGYGQNTPPAEHENDGIRLANQISPLDASGNRDLNGKYVLVGIGISTLKEEMLSFVPMATSETSINPHLVIVNGGQAQASATDYSDLSSPYWGTILNNLIPNAGVTAQQVVAVMFEDLDVAPTGTYPSDMVQLQGEFETVAQNVLKVFPNVKLMYYFPRFYSGYSGTTDLRSPEPYAYEQGFAIQGALLDQINGVPWLNYDAKNGPVLAPWLGYGAYTWANGMIARSDGLTYSCQDVLSDGRHPSPLYGAPKIAAQFLNFYKTNPTTAPWFLSAPLQKPRASN